MNTQNFGGETSCRTVISKVNKGDWGKTQKCVSGKYVVRMGGGWNWLRIVSNGRLWY
jgi:hypothetical protein